jgi:hypothetical protein
MSERAAIPIELNFKGDRHYLHGTDVYEAAVSSLRGRWPDIDGRCRFTFHRITSRPLSAICEPFVQGAARPNDCVAEMHVTGGQHQASTWFVERNGDVTGRYPYDEDRVVTDCTVEGNRIAIGDPPQAKPIEIVVAMTKRLHYSLLKPEAGRWLFTRLDLNRLLQPGDLPGLSITVVAPVRSAITRSGIRAYSGDLGSIYFSVGQT